MKQWPAIVRQYTPLVWQTVYRLVPHDADASDCFQEVFVSAWKIARRQPVENWPGLLRKLATVRALDHLRRRGRSARFAGTSDSTDVPSPQTGPPQQAEAAELAGQLRDALANLPARQRLVWSLRHLGGQSYEQIATESGLTVTAVGVILHRATGRLRAAMAPVLAESRNPR